MHPLLAAAVVAVATWDAWRWYLGRIGSAPEEAAALGLTVLFFAVFSTRQRPTKANDCFSLPPPPRLEAGLPFMALNIAFSPLRGRAIVHEVGGGFGRTVARPNPPIYVLAAQAAIHDNGPRMRCKWTASKRGPFGFSLEHHKADACRGWPPARPGRNLGILDRAFARSRIPSRPHVVSICDCPALRGEDNDGYAKRCRREVGVVSVRLVLRDKWPEVTPTSHGQIDFCEEQKSSRAVLPPQGGGGEKRRTRARGAIKCDSPALKRQEANNCEVVLVAIPNALALPHWGRDGDTVGSRASNGSPEWVDGSSTRSLLLPVSALLALYALSFGVLPPIGRAALAITATLYCLYHAVFRQRPPLAFWGLVALALPVLPSLQFMLGYPMRIVSAAMTVGLLRAQGLMIERQGTFLVWRGEMVQFDAPCSGINMLWAELLLTLMGCVLLRLSAAKTIAAVLLSIIVSVAANVLRASSLFYIEAGILSDTPAWWHDAIGLAAFALAALAMLWILLRLEHWRLNSLPTATIDATETGPAR
jgi:exosortase/archaeosortase family protein